MSQPSREEVEAFITALNYGMKVSHTPEFLIALAEGWLENHKPDTGNCTHEWFLVLTLVGEGTPHYACRYCGKRKKHDIATTKTSKPPIRRLFHYFFSNPCNRISPYIS